MLICQVKSYIPVSQHVFSYQGELSWNWFPTWRKGILEALMSPLCLGVDLVTTHTSCIQPAMMLSYKVH